VKKDLKVNFLRCLINIFKQLEIKTGFSYWQEYKICNEQFIDLELSSLKYAWLKIIIDNFIPFSLNINSIFTKKISLYKRKQICTNINYDVLFEIVQHSQTLLLYVDT